MSPRAQQVHKVKAGVAMATVPRTTGATTATRPADLRRDAIGLREVLFQSITDVGAAEPHWVSCDAGGTPAGAPVPMGCILSG